MTKQTESLCRIDIYITPDNQAVICWPKGAIPDADTVRRVSARIAQLQKERKTDIPTA